MCKYLSIGTVKIIFHATIIFPCKTVPLRKICSWSTCKMQSRWLSVCTSMWYQLSVILYLWRPIETSEIIVHMDHFGITLNIPFQISLFSVHINIVDKRGIAFWSHIQQFISVKPVQLTMEHCKQTIFIETYLQWQFVLHQADILWRSLKMWKEISE